MEHWTSLYIASRFPRAEQWWPTDGEDVGVALRSFLSSPGKVLMLEIKVPEATATGHRLSISTEQLSRYLGRGLPVFYVLPVPFWSGPIGPSGSVPITPASWWRRRSQREWFGNWTYVLSAADVAAHVSMTTATPVLYNMPDGGPIDAAYRSTLAVSMPWPIFWSEIQKCGPEGAVTWRITEGPDGEVSTKNLAAQEQVDSAGLQVAYRAQIGDNLVILHIDESELRVDP